MKIDLNVKMPKKNPQAFKNLIMLVWAHTFKYTN